jgi:hypothetical protein
MVVAGRRAALRRHLRTVNNGREAAPDVTGASVMKLLTRRVNGAGRVHDAVPNATI